MYRKPQKNDHVTIKHGHPLYQYEAGFILAIRSYMVPDGEIQTFFDIGLTDDRHNVHSIITINERYVGLVSE